MKKIYVGFLLLLGACGGRQSSSPTATAAVHYDAGTFGYDLDFLSKHDNMIVLRLKDSSAQIAISPKYQAKVFTSTADGLTGRSFGWIHYKAFDGPVDAHMNGYGGENRIWLGPEGGVFSLFFKKGDPMVFANWHTPGAFDTAAWTVMTHDARSATLKKDMQLVNYAGTSLSLTITRNIAILDRDAINERLKLTLDTSVKAVGYQTDNMLTNTGQSAWDEQTGMPCIWMLDMFNPSPATAIVIPYKDSKEKVATTDYFGEIPADRIKYDQSVLFFKADGKSRGKLGIHPRNARTIAGSYDAQNKVLTLTIFDVDSAGKYLNQEWNTRKPAFSGDAVNAYNDGPLADGSQMGPFYEIESVSPAVGLAPGQSLNHRHAVFHFTGDEAGLDKISQAWFGVGLDKIKKVF